jgi:hypothetical protein
LAALGRFAGLTALARALPTLFPILFFVVLTQHPLPDPETLDCPVSTQNLS